ncbi:efflux RND transporter periplasmic adaptor subunit [Ferruginibacter albus]|uniref:efflux RND transporter periplasmic adaptor subunit n=1 Tax=Ferruginibacter albus TaxID=2875540 RepID=UPI001CC5E797|nr:efflux RND transporter periplasmic adaptor subunit [Ferruginibacter albus]UAY52967.1 efflux RND transporter periplasmic adaptor subunit [Ferruginibacter albus]
MPVKNLSILGSIFSVFILVSCHSKKDVKPKKDAPVIVDVLIAKSQSVDNTIEANGTIIANNSVQLHPEVVGRLVYLNIPEGKAVKKGTVLARLNDADLQAQLAKSKVQLDLYQKTEERLKQLLDVNGVNQADYDAALNNVNGTKADIQYTQALIDKTIIKAPFDGVIGLRQVSIGAYVSPSDVIASMQQTNGIRIDFTLPEQYSDVIKIGGKVNLEVDAANEAKRTATIIAMEPQINQDSRNMTVRAIVQDGKGNIGSFVKVLVDVGANKKAILVPTNSIIPDDKNNQVIVVKNDKANFVNVQIGIRQANNVEIVKGINEGDTVVVTGVLFAKPKAALKVRKAKTLEQFASEQ